MLNLLNEEKINLTEEKQTIKTASEDIFTLSNPFEYAKNKLKEESEMMVAKVDVFSMNPECLYSFPESCVLGKYIVKSNSINILKQLKNLQK